MEYLVLGFFTGLSLILAIGAQNIFVIEQGLKKQHILLVCLVCSISDLILIFLGIFLFHYFVQYFNSTIELIFNILLIIFLTHFIYSKIKFFGSQANFDNRINYISKLDIFLKTLGFTNLSLLKIFFVIGLTIGLIGTISGTILGIIITENLQIIQNVRTVIRTT